MTKVTLLPDSTLYLKRFSKQTLQIDVATKMNLK